ncbi:flagellar basal-body rod protein FlgC [Brevundimonas intermedia]|uniref:Flagellar basal-body rod protein FlgC n=1 Tax=Brevundimonas intermedia TaxID=74315 RepID=A0ABQ5TBH1_9CAUL|nr:flagellar basal body rod protein FlgC [Brevundimonas intermedia]GLK50164.1 flagellar basal-body rod protein FlgC [Brevundimonas intermedia]
MDAMQISRTGLDVEWRRMEVIAANLANLNTTRTALGDAYRPLRLVSGPRASFEAHLSAEDAALGGVAVYGVEPQAVQPRRVHEPGHPHADAEGFVTYPGLDHAGEMTLLVQTARAYEANLVALGAGRQMYAKALEIGRR